MRFQMKDEGVWGRDRDRALAGDKMASDSVASGGDDSGKGDRKVSVWEIPFAFNINSLRTSSFL